MLLQNNADVDDIHSKIETRVLDVASVCCGTEFFSLIVNFFRYCSPFFAFEFILCFSSLVRTTTYNRVASHFVELNDLYVNNGVT